MLRTGVPETSVNENDDPCADEREIRLPRQLARKAVSEAKAPKRLTQRTLGLRILSADTGHAAASLLGGHYVGHGLASTVRQSLRLIRDQAK